MDRIEQVREYVDRVLAQIADASEKRCGYVHLYGVAQACAMIAMKRKEHVELAIVAGMLHDLYSYSTSDAQDHARKGAMMARDILESFRTFDSDEIKLICDAIGNHSDKEARHSPFDEVLIDADVLQHCLYAPSHEVAEHERTRLERLKREFGLA